MRILGWHNYECSTIFTHYTKYFINRLIHNYIYYAKDKQIITKYIVYAKVNPKKIYDRFDFRLNPPLPTTQKNIEYILNKSLNDLAFELI